MMVAKNIMHKIGSDAEALYNAAHALKGTLQQGAQQRQGLADATGVWAIYYMNRIMSNIKCIIKCNEDH